MPASVCVVDEIGNLLQVNETWKEFAIYNGFNNKSLLFTDYNYFDVCQQDIKNKDAKAILEGLKGLLAGTIFYFDYEYPCHVPDKQQWFLLRAQLMKTEAKQIVISHTDITDRKLAVDKLRQSNLLLEATQEIAKVGGWELDIATGELFWTAETYRILETSPSEFIPTVDAVVNFYLPESQKMISKALELSYKNGQGFNLELEMYTAKENHIYVCTTCEVTLRDGAPDKLTGTFQDITKQKEQEFNLIKAKENAEISKVHLDNIINNIGDPVFVKGEDSRLLLVNDAFCVTFAMERDNIIGKTLADDVTPDESELFLKIDREVLKTGKESIFEESLTVRGKPTRIISTRKTRYIDNNKNKFLIGVIRDITEKVRHENELNQALTEITDLKQELEAENLYLKEELHLTGRFNEIIGSSKSLVKILKQIEQVAKTDSTVLILGETGTGKELISKAIQQESDRKNKPFIKVNCLALPAELIESELFGHEKGAFTSAINRKIGRFELANNGTIFLDEIGDLPLSMQTKLLRVLQENEFERVGGEQTIKVDVRVIAATNRNLEARVVEGEFRQDLYYRLNVYPITSPPLRDRKDDIPELVNHFINKYNYKVSGHIKSIHTSTIEKLMGYQWPGNIRELEHVIERAIIMNAGSQLRLGSWFKSNKQENMLPDKLSTLEEVERNYIIKVLKETNGKIRGKNAASEILGLKPTTLESRMKKLNINK